MVMLIGAGYLFWLAYSHFFGHADAAERRTPKKAAPWLGLSAFWATVVKVELTDIVFAVDSILVAVAMSNLAAQRAARERARRRRARAAGRRGLP